MRSPVGLAPLTKTLVLMLPTLILPWESEACSEKSYLIYQQTFSLDPQPRSPTPLLFLLSVHLAASRQRCCKRTLTHVTGKTLHLIARPIRHEQNYNRNLSCTCKTKLIFEHSRVFPQNDLRRDDVPSGYVTKKAHHYTRHEISV